MNKKELILKRICKDCGEKVKYRNANRCIECHMKWRRGKNCPNWKGGRMVTKNCKQCGREFEHYPRSSIGHYCGFRCLGKSKQNRILNSCENCDKEFEVPLSQKRIKCCSKKCSFELKHKKSLVSKTCRFCGDLFDVLKKDNYRIYCSMRCVGDHRKIIMKGSGNPRWLGGTDAYRGKDWNEQKLKALKRDKFTCMRCEKQNCLLHVHHRTPYRISKNNELKNLVTLCASCHTTVENDFKKYGIGFKTHLSKKTCGCGN